MAERGMSAYYRLYAARCLEMSREVSNEASRASLLTMAQVWMALSDQADASRQINAPELGRPRPASRVAQQQPQPKKI